MLINDILRIMKQGHAWGIRWIIMRCGSHILGKYKNKGNDLADKLANHGAACH